MLRWKKTEAGNYYREMEGTPFYATLSYIATSWSLCIYESDEVVYNTYFPNGNIEQIKAKAVLEARKFFAGEQRKWSEALSIWNWSEKEFENENCFMD